MRFSLLLLNVILVLRWDLSGWYHYIRGESFLKLYVVFNMLEMCERWLRSVGVDLFDILMASVRRPLQFRLVLFGAALIYCFIHSTMHLLRVVLLNVAINTGSSAVFLIVVTNSFGEIKSTVFKRYEAKSLFVIIASDIVERFYLFLDILFVLIKVAISAQRGMVGAHDIAYWIFLFVLLEVGTDLIKFCLIFKFSELRTSTLETCRDVLIGDILLCRQPIGSPDGKSLRGIHSFSHILQRRLGFSGVPMTTLVVIHVVMIARSPCMAVPVWPGATVFVFGAMSFVLALLAKVLLGVSLLGFAVRRRMKSVRSFEVSHKLRAL